MMLTQDKKVRHTFSVGSLFMFLGGGRGGGSGARRGRDQDDDDDSLSSRPSGPATLFDFLETKIPTKTGNDISFLGNDSFLMLL